MADYANDARFQELQFLAQLDQSFGVKKSYPRGSVSLAQNRELQMILSLIWRGMLNGPDVRSTAYASIHADVDRQDRFDRARCLQALLQCEEVFLEVGHLGRLRLYELQDELKATRLREAFGILFDGRYVERDLAVAILNSRPEAPVSLAYLDMNGLKAFNEDGDHATGDAAIKAFFHVVEKAVSGVGEAYRKGGDEVVVIMPGTPLDEARSCMRAALMALSTETITVKGQLRKLSSACGLLSLGNPQAQPGAELHRADILQKKAKAASKLADGSRCSALTVEANTELL